MLRFGDDTKIFTRITDDNDWHSLQDDLAKLTTWSENGKCFSIPANVK